MQSLTTYQRTQECLGNDDVDFHNDLNLQRPYAAEVLDARYDLCVAIMKGEYNPTSPFEFRVERAIALMQGDFLLPEYGTPEYFSVLAAFIDWSDN